MVAAAQQLMDPHDPSLWSPQQLRILRHRCLVDPMTFSRVFHRVRFSSKFRINWHHYEIHHFLSRMRAGEITRGIINLPYRCSKTQLAVHDNIALGLAINPRSRYLHLTSGEGLALDNSTAVRDVITSALYQSLWPMRLRVDTKAKYNWTTDRGGGLIARPAGGQVVGHGAGLMEDGFTGMLIIDDPVKPDDVESLVKTLRINKRYPQTIQSRIAHPKVPILVLMQRLGLEDMTEFLLKGGSGEVWHHLEMPAEFTEETEDYPSKRWTHGRPVVHKYKPKRKYFWPYRFPKEDIDRIRKAAEDVYWAQLQQRPKPIGGQVFDIGWFQYYERFDPISSEIILTDGSKIPIEYKGMYADTAQKTAEVNDASSLQLWGKLIGEGAALIEHDYGRWDAPDLEAHTVEFIKAQTYKHKVNHMGLRQAKVEDKSSGTGLIQAINKRPDVDVEIEGIPRDKDKLSRAKSAAVQLKKRIVYLPINAPWLEHYLKEFQMFSALGTHKHDDQIDATMDAVHDMCIMDDALDYGRGWT